MATVYDVNVTIVSDYVHYPKEELKEIISILITNYINKKSGLKLKVHDLTVDIIA